MMQKASSNYQKAILWFMLSLVVGCSNDAIMKYMGTCVSPWQVAFFRCLFGTMSLLPLMLYHGSVAFKTHRPWLHLLRGGLLFIAISTWCHGVKEAPIATATTMSFTVHIFVLLLAPILLKERVTRAMWFATLMGFGGILLILQPGHSPLHRLYSFFILATLAFSLLDIINKKYVTHEPMLCMLFYSTLIATVLLALPALYADSMPTKHVLSWLGVLGIGSNLILYFLLKAFELASASSLAPFRYLELPISIGVSYVFFQEPLTDYSYFGAVLIIASTLFIVYTQNRKTTQST